MSVPQTTVDFYDKMNKLGMDKERMREEEARRADRRTRGLGMRLNAAALDEPAPWAIKAGKRKSRRNKKGGKRKSRRNKKGGKSRRRR